MVMVNKFGQMEHIILVTGKIIEQTEMANLFMLMEIYTMETGSTIKQMVLEYMYI